MQIINKIDSNSKTVYDLKSGDVFEFKSPCFPQGIMLKILIPRSMLNKTYGIEKDLFFMEIKSGLVKYLDLIVYADKQLEILIYDAELILNRIKSD